MSKYKNTLIKAWLLNVAVLALLSWALEPFLTNKLLNNLPEDAGFEAIGVYLIGVSIIYGLILLLTTACLAVLFKKMLGIKRYTLFALLPQLALGVYAWLSQYHWWPPITSSIISFLVSTALLLLIYILMGHRLDGIYLKSVK